MIHATWVRFGPAVEPHVAKITIEVGWPPGALIPVGRFREAQGRVNAVEIGGVPLGHLRLKGISTRFRPERWTHFEFVIRSERWDEGESRAYPSFDFAALLGSSPEGMDR
jgi:hypothetical protein